MPLLPVEPPPRPRRRIGKVARSSPPATAMPDGFGRRVEWLAALIWATICSNPGWVLSLAIHGSVLACLSVIFFSSARSHESLGIEGSFGDGGGGGGGSFETVLDSPGAEVGSVAETSIPLRPMLSSDSADEAVAQAIEQLARVGLSGGVGEGEGAGSGGGSGGGTGGGQGPGLGAAFFGSQGEGKSFVFVVDGSGSMQGERFRRAIGELISSINRLKPQQSFYVFFFNDKAIPLYDPRPANGLQPATPANKARATRWIRSRVPSSTTDPNLAIRQALEMKPDVIFLLTDGELDDPAEVRYMIRRSNKSGAVIHTIAFENPDGATTLETIARENEGTFKFVK